ncbi:hypothetical protein BJN34_35960 (plasmid) [Cupriavidus necator]|uniref:Uncharacterized protein n=1 Tax=Cupriavidus necator TaxID=106590 RepID=A0A1U9V2Z4_CUPNE|nr:hypothetical protein [Cupriavidus necator]AQV99273.1 hypothetical protein BJN34_35960 [Cupriavidus necator]
MNYDEFFREASRLSPASLGLPQRADYRSSLDNEALFQLPLLAMVILTLSKGSSKPRLSELGQLVGECLERTVSGFKGSSQDIGWSANLRIRTVKALTFLERTNLVTVEGQQVTITHRGRPFIVKVLEQETMLADALLIVERSYNNIRAERLVRAEV